MEQQSEPIIVERGAELPESGAKRSFTRGIVTGGIVLVVVLLVGSAALAYRFPDDVPVMPRLLSAVGAPVASFNGSWMNWHDLGLDIIGFKKQIADLPLAALPTIPSNDEIRMRALQRMMVLTAAKDLLTARGVTISSDDVARREAEIAAQSGGKEKMVEMIKQEFGWTYEEYVDRVVRATVIADKLYKEPARAKILEIQVQIKSGADFATLAKQFSQDGSAAQGGDLGFFERGKMVAPFEEAAFKLGKGQVSDVVESEFGFHLIKVEDVKKKRDGTVTAVRARHILIKLINPETALEIKRRVDEMNVRQFIYTKQKAQDALDNAPLAG